MQHRGRRTRGAEYGTLHKQPRAELLLNLRPLHAGDLVARKKQASKSACLPPGPARIGCTLVHRVGGSADPETNLKRDSVGLHVDLASIFGRFRKPGSESVAQLRSLGWLTRESGVVRQGPFFPSSSSWVVGCEARGQKNTADRARSHCWKMSPMRDRRC